MYKFFAKTLFLGKNVVFLPHCHSTNEVTKTMAKSGTLSNGSIVITDFQENGRGQQGNVWLSEKAKNLLHALAQQIETHRDSPLVQRARHCHGALPGFTGDEPRGDATRKPVALHEAEDSGPIAQP